MELPLQLRPRLVIEFSEGFSLLLEDHAAIAPAADFIATFRFRNRPDLVRRRWQLDCWRCRGME